MRVLLNPTRITISNKWSKHYEKRFESQGLEEDNAVVRTDNKEEESKISKGVRQGCSI